MATKKWILIVLAVLIVGAGLAIWNAQRELGNIQPEPTEVTASDEDNLVGENVTFTITEGGKKKWEFIVKKATYYKGREGAKLDQVDGQLYKETGEVLATFHAPRGDFNQKSNQLTLLGGVVVEEQKKSDDPNKPAGNQIQSDQMNWKERAKYITATGNVRIKTPFGESTASKCDFSLDFSYLQLEGDVLSAFDI